MSLSLISISISLYAKSQLKVQKGKNKVFLTFTPSSPIDSQMNIVPQLTAYKALVL